MLKTRLQGTKPYRKKENKTWITVAFGCMMSKQNTMFKAVDYHNRSYFQTRLGERAINYTAYV
jgi:hypothetical protein